MSWTLKQGVKVVSLLNAACHKHHFALAGGVLNFGFSKNDLDVIVLRRAEHRTYKDVLPFLINFGFKVYKIKGTNLWTVVKVKTSDGKHIDFLFPCKVTFDTTFNVP